MKHFDLAQWTDFVRGLASQSDHGAIEEHLATGCIECREWVNLFTRVAAAAAGSRHVPESLAERARAVFEARHSEQLPALPRLGARLAYDSFRDPLPAGVRSTQPTSRQALFQAGDYCLDLRLETDPNEREFTLIGQIANRKMPGEQMADIPVFLLSGDDVLLSARSTEFGEFHIEYTYERNLRLCVPIQTLAAGHAAFTDGNSTGRAASAHQDRWFSAETNAPGCLIEIPLGRFLSGGAGRSRSRGGTV